MVRKAIQLCKDLSDPITKIEVLLTTPCAMLKRSECIVAMREAALPFQKLEAFNSELSALHQVYVPAAKRQKN